MSEKISAARVAIDAALEYFDTGECAIMDQRDIPQALRIARDAIVESSTALARMRAERDEAREYGAQARIRENEERAKFEEMRGRAEAAEARADALAAKVEGMEKVLEPFASLRDGRFMTNGLKYDYRIDVAWIRAARAARAALGSGG